MGMEAVAVGLGLNALSSLFGAHQSEKRAKKDSKRLEKGAEAAQGMMSEGPSDVEQMLREFLGGLPSEQNLGQDGLLQMLMRSPSAQVGDDAMNILMGIAETGDPFELSGFFDAMSATDKRTREDALAEYRAGSAGLGQRFGTASRAGEADLLTQLVENAAARNAQVALGAHDAAAGRRLGALEQILSRTGATEQLAVQRARDAGSYELGANQQVIQALGQLIGAEQGRAGQNAQLLSLALGLPINAPPSYGYANAGQDVAQTVMMIPFLLDLFSRP